MVGRGGASRPVRRAFDRVLVRLIQSRNSALCIVYNQSQGQKGAINLKAQVSVFYQAALAKNAEEHARAVNDANACWFHTKAFFSLIIFLYNT